MNEFPVSQKPVEREVMFSILQEKNRMGNFSSLSKMKDLIANIIYAHKT